MCLAVPDHAALLRVAAELQRRGIAHLVIHEPDAPLHGEASAIGLFPVRDRRPVRAALGRLPLYGGEP